MHYKTFWLSSLFFASLASASPPYPRKRFPYPNKGVFYPYTTGTGTGIYPTGTGIYPTGTSPPCPSSGGTFYTYTPSTTSTAITSSTDSPSASTTLSSTTSVTHPPTGTPTSFKIQYQKAYDYEGAPALNGFANLIPGSTYDHGAQIQGYTEDAALAATFTLNADGSLSVGNLFADLAPQAAYADILFQTEATIASGGYYKTYCELGPGGYLSCVTNTGSYYDNDVYYTCGGTTGPYGINVGPTGRPYQNYCYTLSLLAVPL